MDEPLGLLAITAHPGDELAVAGTLAQHARAGVHVSLACATAGEDGERAAAQEHDLRCACARLGVAEVHLLGYRAFEAQGQAGAAGTLGGMPAWEIVRRLVRLIRTVRPQVMITFGPDGIDRQVDHVAIGGLATQAFGATDDLAEFPAEKDVEPYAPAKLFYFGLPEGLLRLAGLPGPGTPDESLPARLDVSLFVDLKLDAARCYRSGVEAPMMQLLQFPPAERAHLLGTEFLELAQPQPAVDDRGDPHLFAGIP